MLRKELMDRLIGLALPKWEHVIDKLDLSEIEIEQDVRLGCCVPPDYRRTQQRRRCGRAARVPSWRWKSFSGLLSNYLPYGFQRDDRGASCGSGQLRPLIGISPRRRQLQNCMFDTLGRDA
jgi:hypothetical protein